MELLVKVIGRKLSHLRVTRRRPATTIRQYQNVADTQQDVRSEPANRPVKPSRSPATLLAALAAAVVVAVLVLILGGGVITDAVPGLPERDSTVSWLVPMLKLAHDVLAALTVGCLIAAAFFVDGEAGKIRLAAYRWLRVARWTAFTWVLVSVAQGFANYADFLAQDLSSVTPDGLFSYLWHTENGFAYVLTAVLALVVAVIAFNTLTVSGTAFAAVTAIAACLPVVFTGHSASSGSHQIAVDSMLFHVVGAVLWFGGLAALLIARGLPRTAVHRYSRVALVAFCAVAVSGVINAATRIYSWGELFGSAYGREVVLKAVALLILGGFGVWHRRITLPRLDERPKLFRRFAGVELVIMAATFGLAAALSRTPSPPEPQVNESAMQALLGFPMPPPLTAKTLVLDWYPELVICTLAACAVGLYTAGMIRLHRRGDSWPVARWGTWTLGWVLAVCVTSSGMGRYSIVMFSVHMVEHMTLNMLVPILLALGAPITLALRTLRPSKARGPREWLLLILHSRVVKAVAHPLVALALYALSLYLMYFTSLFEWAMRSHAGHLYMLFHFLAAGGLFYWLIIGQDPAPRKLPYPAKVLLFFLAIVFHAIFGLTIMQSTDVLAPEWYEALARDWGPSLITDQHTGGGIAWAFGEPPSLIVLIALVWQWSRSEDREAKRFDRRVDRAVAQGHPEDDPHEQYNAYLARLAEADRNAGLRE